MARILVVEDETVTAWYLQEALEHFGHQVVANAMSGEEALQKTDETQPDLVLMDIRLQGEMDGIATAERIGSRFRIPIVYLTAHADDSTLSRAIATNPFGYLVKPFQEREVHTTIEIALRRHHLEQRSQNTTSQLQEQNFSLELTQVNLNARLQERTTQLQQAIACIQLLQRVMAQVSDTSTEIQILQTVISELGGVLEADYCWVALYNAHHTLATISCEYIAGDELHTYPSALGTQINMESFPDFYRPLLQKHYWLSPSLEFLPTPYNALLTADSQMLSCPLVAGELVIGEISLLCTGKPPWSQHQAELVAQVISQCTTILRQANSCHVAQNQVQDLEVLNHLKDNFVRLISRELFTPIANMRMAVEILSSLVCSLHPTDNRIEIPPNQQLLWQKLEYYVQVLREEWQHESELIGDLLNFQQMEALHEPTPFSRIDWHTWLPQLISRFSEQAIRQRQVLSCDVSPELLPLISHEPSLERIITELLTNACKFSPPDSWIALTAKSKGDNVVIQVTNTGITILPDQLERIFEPFYRIPNPQLWNSSAGLGLALVKKLVQLLGGEIQVYSQGGETTFKVTLVQEQP